MCQVELMSSNSQLGAENPHIYFKMAMTVLGLELQGGKKIRMSLLSSLISVQNLMSAEQYDSWRLKTP